jgi:hypothetical protein
MRSIGIEVLHKMMATLVQELRNEEQFIAKWISGFIGGEM